MNDLLFELKESHVDDLDDIELEDGNAKESQVELVPEPTEHDKFVEDFHQSVSDIRSMMSEIDRNAKRIEERYNESFAMVKNNKKNADLKEEISNLRDSTKEKIDRVKKQLELLGTQNKQLLKTAPGNAILRIRENQYASLTQEFMRTVKEWQRVNTEYKAKHRENLARQIRIVNKDASEEDVDKMIENGFEEESLFRNQIMKSSAAHTARVMFDEINETREDLLKLETDMNELFDMFRDMNMLLNMQQDLIDNIEKNVSRSTNYIEKATKNLRMAKRIQKKSSVVSAAIICLCVLIAVAIAIAVTIIVIGLGIWAGIMKKT